MEERNISEKESIELIARMIKNTQHRMEQGAGTPMLIWAFATIIATIAVWISIRLTHNYSCHYLWFLIPVLGTIGMLLRKKKNTFIRTHIDQTVFQVWLVLGGTGLAISCLSIFRLLWNFPILFVIILFMGMATVLTGLITKYKPMVIGGISGMVIGFVQHLVRNEDLYFLLFALSFVVMMVIPGFILNYRAKKHV